MPGKNELSELDYKEAETLMDSLIIRNNHKILDKTIDNIEDSTLICENPEIELNKMRSEVFYIMPDFLIEPKDAQTKELKYKIKLYIENYESLCNQINKLVETTSKSLNNLYEPSNNMKNELNRILKDFEETVKNLCTPLISEKKGLKSIDENKLNDNQKDIFCEDRLSIIYKIEMFKKESDNLNLHYKELFKNIKESVQIICNSIQNIPNTIVELQNKIEEGMSNFEEILELIDENTDKESLFRYLNRVKESLEFIMDKKEKIIKQINEDINHLNIQYIYRKESLEILEKSIDKSIENLKEKSNLIKNDIIKIREKNNLEQIQLQDINISKIIIDRVLKSVEESGHAIKEENKDLENEYKDIVIKRNSLDLLLIMDITGSMELYLEQVKKRLFEILGNIEKKCLGVDINLGFIGYKDVEEIKNNDYININFTNKYNEVKKEMSEIKVGGGDDTAEDIAFAFELALQKNWSDSETKFAILVTDAPCHGIQYHDKDIMDNFLNGVPNRRNIEEIVEDLANKKVSLFCVRLNEKTDIMYNKFKNVYLKVNKYEKKSEFYIAPLKSPEYLVDIVVDNTSIAYLNRINAVIN